jgi:hypothetical protein
MCASQNQESSNHLFATCTTTKTLTNDIINRSMQLGGNTVRDKWDRHAKGTNRAHGQQWYGRYGGSATDEFFKAKGRTCGHWSLRQHPISNNGH